MLRGGEGAAGGALVSSSGASCWDPCQLPASTSRPGPKPGSPLRHSHSWKAGEAPLKHGRQVCLETSANPGGSVSPWDSVSPRKRGPEPREPCGGGGVRRVCPHPACQAVGVRGRSRRGAESSRLQGRGGNRVPLPRPGLRLPSQGGPACTQPAAPNASQTVADGWGRGLSWVKGRPLPLPKVLWDTSLAISKSLELGSTSVKRGPGVPSCPAAGPERGRARGMGGRCSAGRPSRHCFPPSPHHWRGCGPRTLEPGASNPSSRESRLQKPGTGHAGPRRTPARGGGGSCETPHCPSA